MGALEESGKVASGVVDGLKSQPLALALIVLNVLWLLVVFWTQNENGKRDDAIMADVLKVCLQKP
jgi:hypothetical protein